MIMRFRPERVREMKQRRHSIYDAWEDAPLDFKIKYKKSYFRNTMLDFLKYVVIYCMSTGDLCYLGSMGKFQFVKYKPLGTIPNYAYKIKENQYASHNNFHTDGYVYTSYWSSKGPYGTSNVSKWALKLNKTFKKVYSDYIKTSNTEHILQKTF